MSVYRDMATDAGYSGEEAEQMARWLVSEEHRRRVDEEWEEKKRRLQEQYEDEQRRWTHDGEGPL